MIPMLTFGQDAFYYYGDEKIDLNISKQYLYVMFDSIVFNGFENSILNSISDFSQQHQLKEFNSSKWGKLSFGQSLSDIEYVQKLTQIKNTAGVQYVSPYIQGDNNKVIGTSNYFQVKLKNIEDITILQNHAKLKKFTILKQNKFMPKWYELSCNSTTTLNSLEICNFLYETGLYDAIDPAFMFNYTANCTNDPNFSSLWGLKNNSNSNFDINVCGAWSLSTGSGVKVAVLDEGIDLMHTDLSNNISSLSYDTKTGTSPSVLYDSHGTHVAGIIGAIKDNNLQVVGVAPNSTLISISVLFRKDYISVELADGINWAVQNGADIINNSWGDLGGRIYRRLHSLLLENAITNAIINGRNGKGTIIVFSSGNQSPAIDYPAYFMDEIACIGSITSAGLKSGFSGYGQKLDVVAPGSGILSTFPNNSIRNKSGTSMAAPHYSGVAALVLSVNPNLTGNEVRTIIEKTAQKITPAYYPYATHINRPNGTWNNRVGYGLIDAHAAVLLAQNWKFSLYIKDHPSDNGGPYAPFPVCYYDATPDIWARNQDDGFLNQFHETSGLEYYQHTQLPTYVYVRVRNNGTVATKGNGDDKVRLAFYPSSLYNNTNISRYTHINTLNIPALQPGESTILKFVWDMSKVYNPKDLIFPWAFPALLASIESLYDISTVSSRDSPSSLSSDIYYNNNIAIKHVTIVNNNTANIPIETGGGSGVVRKQSKRTLIGNPTNVLETYDLVFRTPADYQGNPITQEAEVKIVFNDAGWDIIQSHIGNKEDIQIIKEKEILIKGTNVTISNLNFPANTIVPIDVSFNFLSDELSNKKEFKYQVIQKYSTSSSKLPNQTTGDIHFIVRKGSRTPFDADAGDDKEIRKGDNVDLNAYDIGELAIYNWYDAEGNLIYTGKDFTVSPEISKKYKLEVIAADGVKDYAEVDVKVKEYEILNMSPNPTSNQITINYKIEGVSSAYLMIITPFSSAYNYILDTNQNSISVDLSNFQTGIYTVLLVCDGHLSDSKNLIKQ